MGTESAVQRAHKSALIKVEGLSKRYIHRAPFSRKKFVIDALVDVDFQIASGCLTAVVGQSGSGKSTLAACLAMFERPDAGDIWFEGQKISGEAKRELAQLRPKIQLVFQDSAGALNPRFTAAEIIAEPLAIQHREQPGWLRARACELMEEVALSASWAGRHPLEFSGGQRQRLAIARALAVNPSFLILDESLSGLDLSTQAQILNLLLDLQVTRGLTYLLISHDLSLVEQVADFVAVMHRGRIVEHGPRERVLFNPQHEQTRNLLNSVQGLAAKFRTAQAGSQR
jgi:ABC-type glutathione transport system ATPase component